MHISGKFKKFEFLGANRECSYDGISIEIGS